MRRFDKRIGEIEWWIIRAVGFLLLLLAALEIAGKKVMEFAHAIHTW